MRDPAQRERAVPARERLQHEAAREQVEAGPAVFLGHRDAEVAGRADLRERLGRPPLLVVHPLRERMQLLAREYQTP